MPSLLSAATKPPPAPTDTTSGSPATAWGVAGEGFTPSPCCARPLEPHTHTVPSSLSASAERFMVRIAITPEMALVTNAPGEFV